MPITPEDKARQTIDRLLTAAGWNIQDRKDANISAPGGVAVREFPMPGFGEADYLLFSGGKALGVVEAKRESETRTHVETQTESATAPSTTSGVRCSKTLTRPSSVSPLRLRSRPSASSTGTW